MTVVRRARAARLACLLSLLTARAPAAQALEPGLFPYSAAPRCRRGTLGPRAARAPVAAHLERLDPDLARPLRMLGERAP